jgi:hypothetical protein
MKAYLLTTGTIFGLIAIMHVLRSFAEWQSLKTNPVEFIAMAALGVLAAALSVWAFRLFQHQSRS